MKSSSLLLIVLTVGASAGVAASNCQAQSTLELSLDDSSLEDVDAANPNLIRVRIGTTGEAFQIPLTIAGAEPPPFNAILDSDKGEFEYRLTALKVVVTDGESAATDVLADFDRSAAGHVAIDLTATQVDRALGFQAVAEFELAVKGGTVADVPVTVAPRYPSQTRISPLLKIVNDRTGPMLAGTLPVERFPGGGGVYRLQFKDDDLDVESIGRAFTFTQFVDTTDVGRKSVSVVPEGAPQFDRNTNTLSFNFRNLNPGPYQLGIADAQIKDTVGNVMEAITTTFDVPGGRQHGTQVEYPRHLTPGDEGDLLMNPGDRVDTRDVRLYYFRDAHRVAEIINRNTRSLNQTGYDAAQRFAQDARQAAENEIDERRRIETLAVQAAQTTRATRKALNDARETLEEASERMENLEDRRQLIDDEVRRVTEANGLTPVAAGDASETKVFDDAIVAKQGQVDAKQQEIETAEARNSDVDGSNDVSAEALAQLNSELAQLKRELQELQDGRRSVSSFALVRSQESRELERLNSEFTKAQGDVTRLEQKTIADEQEEIRLRNDVQGAEAKELRAEQERFRREVAAGLSDRDTYVAGKLTSIDPVTQVTITVVGEGRLQLRGPVNGINKICRMVHQIDSPVGQVKIGIHTVQINGEHGDRMERVYEDIEKHVARSRFLTNQSTLMFRKAVSRVASEVADRVDSGYVPPGCEQVFLTECVGQNSRDLKYMYGFFGRDFIDELRAMDSELLQSDNKLLSLHSMDTISLAGALQVAALANNTSRLEIIRTFQMLIQTELVEKEIQYYRTMTRTPHRYEILNRLATPKSTMRRDEKDAEEILFNAHRNYNFANTVGFFDSQVSGEGTLNNVQYAVLRLAQTLKAQLIAEQELKNLVKQLSLLETREGEIETDYRTKARQAASKLKAASAELDNAVAAANSWLATLETVAQRAENAGFHDIAGYFSVLPARLRARIADRQITAGDFDQILLSTKLEDNLQFLEVVLGMAAQKADMLDSYGAIMRKADGSLGNVVGIAYLDGVFNDVVRDRTGFTKRLNHWKQAENAFRVANAEYERAKREADEAEELLFSKRMLIQFIDEQEEKSVELLEALRSHSSNVDNYLKRLAIALEDDVNAQYYEPAFQKVRRVSRTYDVSLGQIETTTVLTNNRTLAKVSPAATMEFDLPQREILITEAMNNMNALTKEYGNLLQEGTFLAGTSLLAGQPAAGIVGGASPVQQIPGISNGEQQQFGAALEGLIPDPAIYKFETGTGFEIRPVIQPDGHSIVYNFNYMYTTNVREPVRADEKHLGRVKRHFVHTDVQTSSYELREVSRYMVALKASRTSRGVPGLEDVPIAGVLFRPAASAESSLQQNIILASSVIYPTVYDLMGLRWSPYVDELSSSRLASEKVEQRARYEQIRRQLLSRTQAVVNRRLGITNERPVETENITPGPALLPTHAAQLNIEGTSASGSVRDDRIIVPHQHAPNSQYDPTRAQRPSTVLPRSVLPRSVVPRPPSDRAVREEQVTRPPANSLPKATTATGGRGDSGWRSSSKSRPVSSTRRHSVASNPVGRVRLR